MLLKALAFQGFRSATSPLMYSKELLLPGLGLWSLPGHSRAGSGSFPRPDWLQWQGGGTPADTAWSGAVKGLPFFTPLSNSRSLLLMA